MSFWSQAFEIARVDLRVERRVGDTFRVILPFSIVGLLVFPLALGIQLATIQAIGPAVFWAIAILFGMQIALRQSVTDTPWRRDLYALTGLDPGARFIGRCMSGTVLMVGFLAVLFVAMVIFYSPEMSGQAWGLIVLSVVLFAIGVTELATMAGELTTGLRNRGPLASLIIAPLSLPLVIGASQVWSSIGEGAIILSWILLLTASVVGLAVVGISVARPLEETAR